MVKSSKALVPTNEFPWALSPGDHTEMPISFGITATIPPPRTTNPSGTFTKLLNMSESLGNFMGAGKINFGSIAVAGIKKGNELKNRKSTLDGIVNTKILKLKKDNPSMNKSSLEKAARTLAFLELRELDKENK